jgi:sugar-specific transcriptional regulator TrmB
MVATSVIRALERLGLSSYVARAYGALLRSGPVTGYQLSRASGVPRSRIYETLEKLAGRGMVITRRERPQLYAAVSSDEVLARRAAEMKEVLAVVRTCCAGITHGEDEEGVWNIAGRANIIGKARAMVQAAQHAVAVMGAARDLAELEAVFGEADKRRCQVRIVACGSFRPKFGETFQHSFGADRCSELVLVVDSAQALVGSTEPMEAASAAWSRAPGFVHVTEEYVLHEVFIARALASLDSATVQSLGDLYRTVFESRP